MADLAVGISKTVVEALVNKVENAIKEEAEQWRIVQSETVFMRDELEMMKSFLRTADWRRIKCDVVRTWVKQVRDLSYDAEDVIESILLVDTKRPSCCTISLWRRLLASCCCYSGTQSPLDQAVAEIKLLKSRVEEVSSRNMRYSQLNDSASMLTMPQELASVSAVATVAVVDVLKEAWCNARMQGFVDLTTLVTRHTTDAIRVVSLWGTGGDLGLLSIIKETYEGSDEVQQKFRGRAWISLGHRPFNHLEFIRSLMHQFYENTPSWRRSRDADVMTRMLTASQSTNPVKHFAHLIENYRYLVVLEGLSNLAEWEAIRVFLRDCKNGSCIVVSTPQLEVATRLCMEPSQVLPLRVVPDGQIICAFICKVDILII
ncbi:hypothetical protein QOZ80_9AG0683840 [Eleusine coracana subsp. coracana]|nr:hypothetical protein QOZ80_9AG0683840 [Eleusine coracana subsp. coracana]